MGTPRCAERTIWKGCWSIGKVSRWRSERIAGCDCKNGSPRRADRPGVRGRVSAINSRKERATRQSRRPLAACLEDEPETQPELPLVDAFPREILHAGDRHEVRAVADVVVGD